MKRLKIMLIVIIICSILSYAAGATAGDMSEIEKQWLNMQKAIADQMLKNGDITKADAEQILNKYKKLLAESREDLIYPSKSASKKGRFLKHGRLLYKASMLLDEYAQVTGRSKLDTLRACDKEKLTVWQMAKKEGRLDALKAKVINDTETRLNSLINEGKLNKEKRDEMLKKLKDYLDKKT